MKPRAALTVIFALILTLILSPSASASTPKPHLAHAAFCPTLLNRTGTQAWFDLHDPHSQLVYGMERLICEAAPSSTIDIKSWFFSPGGATDILTHALAVDHYFRGVTVNVMLGGNAYSTHPGLSWRETVKALHPFATIYACSGGCRAARIKGKPQAGRSHAKWMTISHTLMGTPASVSTSANFAAGAWGTEDNSAIYTNSRKIYRAFRGRWHSLVDCTVHSCRGDKNAPVVYKHGVYYNGRHNLVSTRAGNTAVWFDPQPVDPIALTLRKIHCSKGGHVLVVNAFAKDAAVNIQLQRLAREGCAVSLVITWWPSGHKAQHELAGFSVHCVPGVVQHDKFMVLDTGSAHTVVAGSQDFTDTGSWSSSDQQEIMTSAPDVYRGYLSYFTQLRHAAHTCSKENVRPASKPTPQFVPPPVIPVA